MAGDLNVETRNCGIYFAFFSISLIDIQVLPVLVYFAGAGFHENV